jgi:MoaA/NifB/PqqE/SkfB family radical SAM enzyme
MEILDYEKFVAVVQDAAKLGAMTICISGGEPFLHSKISDMIGFVASLGLQTYVYTSGIVFDKKNQKTSIGKNILKDISSKVTKLIFNIEAATPSTYDKIMGTTGCFEKMKQSIFDAHSFAITTEAHFVPMKLNIDEVGAVIDLCKELKVSKLSFLRLVPHGRAQDNEALITLLDEDLEKLKDMLGELKKQSEVDIRIGVPLSTANSCHKCEAANGKLNIKYDGNVFPCEVFKNDRISNCLKGTKPENISDKPLFDIYNNSKFLNVVRVLSKEFSCTEHCETCIGQYLISKSEGPLNG